MRRQSGASQGVREAPKKTTGVPGKAVLFLSRRGVETPRQDRPTRPSRVPEGPKGLPTPSRAPKEKEASEAQQKVQVEPVVEQRLLPVVDKVEEVQEKPFREQVGDLVARVHPHRLQHHQLYEDPPGVHYEGRQPPPDLEKVYRERVVARLEYAAQPPPLDVVGPFEALPPEGVPVLREVRFPKVAPVPAECPPFRDLVQDHLYLELEPYL